ncbi:hypothetical protein P280DRAFT_193568 [Massarina eburnea CBS 473.64]|uniref:CFEM domain-containing protein n=1 Tax=Massarina eburnea CBS 473.64 TaxID=1395130 RepID=A0A6A6RN72_9PLEO|nr:hypothetical protein P280DRAFT_193568 [Massarina eburnea CBS 473.64]
MWLGAILPYVVLLNGVLAQQTLMDRLPDCAVKCFEATLPTTTCAPTDLNCLCLDEPFGLAVAGCNALNCTVVQTMSAMNETYAACGIPVHSQSAEMIGVTAAFGGLAVIMVVIRLMDRGISSAAKLGWDDLLIGASGVRERETHLPNHRNAYADSSLNRSHRSSKTCQSSSVQ